MSSEKEAEAARVTEERPPSYSATDHAVDIPAGDEPPPYSTDRAGMLDAPPSYDSLFGKVKAAKATSPNNAHFAKTVMGILMATVGCTIMLVLFLAIPISMTVIGGIYLNDCPAERYIPIYLVVAGAFGIIENMSSLLQKLKRQKSNEEGEDQEQVKANPFDGVLSCFLFAWFIAGNVWIYRTYDHWSSDPLSPQYCHPTLYYFAFWMMTGTYIFMAVICCCTCIGGIVAACMKTS